MSDISTIGKPQLQGREGELCLAFWGEGSCGYPSKPQNEDAGWGGEMPRSSAAPTGSPKLRLHRSWEGRGSRPDSKARFSAPPLNPSLWPGGAGLGGEYSPVACLGHLPAPAPFPPSCPLPPTASSLRHQDSVQGLEGPGWSRAHGLTSSLGKLLAFLAGRFAATVDTDFIFLFLVPSPLPHFLGGEGSSRKWD